MQALAPELRHTAITHLNLEYARALASTRLSDVRFWFASRRGAIGNRAAAPYRRRQRAGAPWLKNSHPSKLYFSPTRVCKNPPDLSGSMTGAKLMSLMLVGRVEERTRSSGSSRYGVAVARVRVCVRVVLALLARGVLLLGPRREELREGAQPRHATLGRMRRTLTSRYLA